MTQPTSNTALEELDEHDLWLFRRVIREFTISEHDDELHRAAGIVWNKVLDECERRRTQEETMDG